MISTLDGFFTFLAHVLGNRSPRHWARCILQKNFTLLEKLLVACDTHIIYMRIYIYYGKGLQGSHLLDDDLWA